MPTVQVHVLQSFAKEGKGGNTAGVVTNTKDISEEQMQKIAEQVGFSETAFVLPSTSADASLRFFTPKEEVNLCGHATVAAFTLLRNKKKIRGKLLHQETKAGILEIELRENGTVFYQQTLPVFSDHIPIATMASALQIPPEWIATDLQPQIVSTGMRDILVCIPSQRHLLSMTPDLGKIERLSKEKEIIGIHAFTLEALNTESIAHCRNFAPLYGINEEAATGSSNGALACYLYTYKKIPMNNMHNIIFEQGYSMQSSSEIIASLHTEKNTITKVQIGGTAVSTGILQVQC